MMLEGDNIMIVCTPGQLEEAVKNFGKELDREMLTDGAVKAGMGIVIDFFKSEACNKIYVGNHRYKGSNQSTDTGHLSDKTI